MTRLSILIVCGVLLLATAVYAQQIFPEKVNQLLKEGYSINTITSVGDKGFSYHLTKGKELLTCVSGISESKMTTLCFKP